MIRKITRGIGTATKDGVTISCSITDISKVIVLLDVDGCSVLTSKNTSSYSYYGGLSTGVYLKSVSTTGIVVVGKGFKNYDSSTGESGILNSTVTFSYQIIEFM